MSKKIAFTTVLDDKYLSGFLITLNSILESSKKFNYDVVILEWGELSEESKDIIYKLYPKVIFRMVDIESYKNHEYDETWRIWTYNCNYRFDIFTFTEYDRVVFFDSDMIFEIDIDEILKYDVDFGSCEGHKNGIVQIGGRTGFDGGLMTIGKKYLSPNVKKHLIEIANSPAPHDENVKTNKWVSDEPILNTYFLDKIYWLPDKFNFVTSKVDNSNINNPNNYQFTGHNKPWYGEKIEEKFSKFTIESFNKNTNNKPVLVNLIIKKLLIKCKKQIDSLLLKGIDISKYSNRISPI
jgi:lipopolysaccharide biosynthesis glycosyltransferase